MWDDVSDLSWSLVTTLIENSPMLLLSIGLMGAGYWLVICDADTEYVTTVAKWNVGVVAVVGLLYAWVILLQLWAMHSLKPWVLALDGVLFSGVVALGVGIYNAEGEQYQLELERREEIHRSLTEDVLDTSDVAMFVVNDDGRVAWANRAVDTYFGIDPTTIRGRDVDALIADDIAATLDDPETFETHVTSLYGTDDTDRLECRVPPTDGGPDTAQWLEHRSQSIETGRYEGGRIEYFTNITEQKQAQERLAARERTLREMYDVISAESTPLEEKVGAVIDICRDLLGVDYGAFARIDPDDDAYHVEAIQTDDADIGAGDTIPYSETWCRRMIAEGETIQFETGSAGPDDEFERYVGTPIQEDDSLYGALCFLAREDATFSDWQLTMVELIGDWIGYELQRTSLQEELRRRVADREAKLASFVDAVDEYAIFRVDDTHRITSWNRGAEAITGYERAEILDERLDVFVDTESESPTQLFERAAEQGQVTYQGWWERRDGRTFWADVTISAQTIGDGDTEFVVIVRDTTDEREYERTIETERERLEFLNRVLRHNLLNSLNVVRGRIALVDDNEPDDIAFDDHVNTARSRVEGMIDHIERMRTFTDAIIDDEDHELRPMALDDVIESKTEMLAETHDSATIQTVLPDDGPSVLADPLLGAVIENVVANALIHNDSDAPRVDISVSDATVEVAADESGAILGRADDSQPSAHAEVISHPAITVHVADNGPGIPDDEKSAVLEKGISRLSEPGNGFGLFLVKEMMDTYLGDIDIRDNDPSGTVVDLTFLTATTEDGDDASIRVLAR